MKEDDDNDYMTTELSFFAFLDDVYFPSIAKKMFQNHKLWKIKKYTKMLLLWRPR